MTRIKGTQILDGTIGSSQLGSGSVQEEAIGSNSLHTDAYKDASIPSAAFQNGSVTTITIANDAITWDKIADGVISSNHYGTASIPSAAYSLSSIGTNALQDGSITSVKLANGSVTSDKIATNAVSRASIIPLSIGTDEIENYKVTPVKMERGTQGDILVATGSDGSFDRVNSGTDGSVLSVVNGVPSWTGSVLPSGVIMDWCGRTSPSGWVLATGRTIGSSASGATERANDDTEALFKFLWEEFDNTELPVSGGRGSSASADWSADKTIAIPDLRGRVVAGRDNMGASNAGRITSATANGSGSSSTIGDRMGATGGIQEVILSEGQMPKHSHFAVADNGTQADLGDSWASVSPEIPIHLTGRSGEYNYRFYGWAVSLVPSKGPTSEVGNDEGHTNMPPFMVLSKIIKL